MTVAAEIPLALYDGDGVTVAFPAPWRYLTTAHLLVELIASDGTATPRTLGAHYAATAGATDAGGTVTMVTAPAVGQTLRVRRVTPLAQQTAYPTSGNFPAKSHELALDRLTLMAQELAGDIDDVQARALQVPFGEVAGALPSAADRVGKFLNFDGDGNPSLSSGTGADSGLRADLLANTGAQRVGFVRAGISRRLDEWLDALAVTPEQFGAVALEDGASATSSQSAALKAALESGRIVDCSGKSYVIGDMVDPTDGVAKGLINGNFVRAVANQTDQNAMFSLINQPNIKVRNNSFDYGVTENAGSNDDSSRFLITVGSNDATPSTWVRGIEVTDNRFTGGGNGTPLYARGTIGALIANNTIVDRIVAGSATNDAQNGIDYSYSRGAIVRGNFIDGLYYRVAGVLTRLYSRGIVAVETSNAVINGNFITNVDQGIDFSGGISASLPEGNVGLSCVGNVVSDVRTWGIKFANCARNSVCSGNVVRNFGWGGIVVSGQSSAGSWGDKFTQDLLITGNYIFNPSDYYSRTDCVGIWASYRNDFAGGSPTGIRVTNNTIGNDTGNGRLRHGVVFGTNDGGVFSLFPGAPYNEATGNVVTGQTGAPTFGATPHGVCAVTGTNSQSIANTTWVPTSWNAETVDGEGMHDNSNNPERITVLQSGWYEVSFALWFSSNATGFRQARLFNAGGTIPGGEYAVAAANGVETGINGKLTTYITAGNHVRVEVYQNSGSPLNLLRPNSQFAVRRIEQM